MEARIIEYPRSSGLEYHHNSPLIGEIPTSDYTHFHRSIDQLRSLNERGILSTSHFQNVLVPSSTSPIVIQASGVYSEIKLNDDSKLLNDYQPANKSIQRNGDEAIENESAADEYQTKKDIANVAIENSFRMNNSPQQFLSATSISPINANHNNMQHPQNTYASLEPTSENESQNKSKVGEIELNNC